MLAYLALVFSRSSFDIVAWILWLCNASVDRQVWSVTVPGFPAVIPRQYVKDNLSVCCPSNMEQAFGGGGNGVQAFFQSSLCERELGRLLALPALPDFLSNSLDPRIASLLSFLSTFYCFH